MSALRSTLRRLRATGVWRPASAACLVRSTMGWGREPMRSDEDAMRAAAAWIGRAQDAMGDGGIAGRYSLSRGWTSSYPETTGYTVPTLLALATALGDDTYRARAARCVEFLLSVQLPDGGFPALEIAENRTRTSPFNSAQIVHGLQHWHQATGDPRALDAMLKAARWICDVQDTDGAWRAHFYRGLACTYSAYAACWLAELGAYTGERRFGACAERNLRWVLGHRDPATGWFDACGFSEAEHQARRAFTHTIAYTLSGVLVMAQRLEIVEGIEAVRVAGEALMHRLERSRTLAGVLDHQWRPRAGYVCLTGNAQVAGLWLQLAETTGDLRFVSAAFKAIDEVKQAQSLSSGSEGIRGGVPGSQPIGGDYIPFALPNWAAKFFVDALLSKQRWLATWPATLDEAAAPNRPQPILMAATPGPACDGERTSTPAVVVYTSRISPMFVGLADDWRRRGLTPALVVVESGPWFSLRRLASSVRHPDEDSAAVCRRLGWRFRRVETINAPEAVAAVVAVAPDLAVNAGAGILRKRVLAVPRLGTLGVHMGMLPRYRGMNVAEWAVLHRDSAGCSVFYVDEGIDTGAIVATEAVDISGYRSRDELRAGLDGRQIALLAETAARILESRSPAPARPQQPAEGRQFYRMHHDIVDILNRQLAQPSASRL